MPELSSHGSVTNMRYAFQRNSGAPRRPKGCAEGHKLKPGNTAAVAGTNATASSINSARGSAREEIPADSCGMRRRFLAKSDLIAIASLESRVLTNVKHERYCRLRASGGTIVSSHAAFGSAACPAYRCSHGRLYLYNVLVRVPPVFHRKLAVAECKENI
jgi:hypothetical protein